MHIRKKQIGYKTISTKEKKLDYLPLIINLNHLNENGNFLTDAEIKKIKKKFKYKNDDIYSFDFKIQNEDFKHIRIIKLKNPDNNEPRLFAIYQGKKKGKLLGEGATGKVKIMQDLETNQFYALKITNEVSKKELNNLIKANISPGYLLIKKENIEKYLIGIELGPGQDLQKQFIDPYKFSLIDYSDIPSRHYVLKEKQDFNIKDMYQRDEKGHYIIEPKIKNIVCLDIEDGKPIAKFRQEFEDKGKIDFRINKIILDKLDEKDKSEIIEMIEKFKKNEKIEPISDELHDKIWDLIKQEPYFKQKKQNFPQLAIVGKGMAESVRNLHNMGLIHKDIKPEQFLFYSKTNSTTLIDLGSADDISNKLTSISEGFTFQYIPPEWLLKIAEKKFTVTEAGHEAFEIMKEDTDFNRFITFHKITSENDLWKLCNRIKNNKDNISQENIELNDALEDFPSIYSNLHPNEADNIQQNEKDIYQLLLDHKVKYDDINQIMEYGRTLERKKNELFASRRDTEYLIDNSPESDIYMLGISLGQLFKLTKHINPLYYFDFLTLDQSLYDLDTFAPGNKSADVFSIKSQQEFEQECRLKIIDLNPEEIEKIRDLRNFLEKMTAFFPKDRPNMDQVLEFMDQFAEEFKFSYLLPLVILKIKDFLEMSDEQQLQLIEILKNNRVVLLALETDTKKDIYKVQYFLLKNNISLNENYYSQIKIDIEEVKKMLGFDVPVINSSEKKQLKKKKRESESFNLKFNLKRDSSSSPKNERSIISLRKSEKSKNQSDKTLSIINKQNPLLLKEEETITKQRSRSISQRQKNTLFDPKNYNDLNSKRRVAIKSTNVNLLENNRMNISFRNRSRRNTVNPYLYQNNEIIIGNEARRENEIINNESMNMNEIINNIEVTNENVEKQFHLLKYTTPNNRYSGKQELWNEFSAETIKLASNNIKEKINNTEKISSKELLSLLGQRRNKIAEILQHAKNRKNPENIYGFFRSQKDEDDTTNYAAFEKITPKNFPDLYRYASEFCKQNIKLNSMYNSYVYRSAYLSSIEDGPDPEAKEWVPNFHVIYNLNDNSINITYPSEMNESGLDNEMLNNYFSLMDEYIDQLLKWTLNDGIDDFLQKASYLAYDSYRLLPFRLGTSAIVNWLVRSIALSKGLDIGPENENNKIGMDWAAFLTPSKKQYCEWYINNAYKDVKFCDENYPSTPSSIQKKI